MPTRGLPGVLADIADVAGVEAAMKVAAARGGTQVYIPASPGDDHWLVRLIGMAAAQAVCDRLTCGVGGLRVTLPIGSARGTGRMRAIADQMIRERKSEREIALATGYTSRQIRRRRAAIRDDRQMMLI